MSQCGNINIERARPVFLSVMGQIIFLIGGNRYTHKATTLTGYIDSPVKTSTLYQHTYISTLTTRVLLLGGRWDLPPPMLLV